MIKSVVLLPASFSLVAISEAVSGSSVIPDGGRDTEVVTTTKHVDAIDCVSDSRRLAVGD